MKFRIEAGQIFEAAVFKPFASEADPHAGFPERSAKQNGLESQ